MIEGSTVVRACYPGSFDPLTIAHVAIAEAVREQCRVERVTLVLSERTLGKESGQRTAEERAEVLRKTRGERTWLEVEVTAAQLLVDIASTYEWLVLGADKWNQIREPHWYGSVIERDTALARLPRLAIVERHGHELDGLPDSAVQLVLPDPSLKHVSSSAVRSGAEHWRA